MRLGGALDRYGICALKGLALSIYLPHRLRGSRDRHDQPDRYGFSTATGRPRCARKRPFKFKKASISPHFYFRKRNACG